MYCPVCGIPSSLVYANQLDQLDLSNMLFPIALPFSYRHECFGVSEYGRRKPDESSSGLSFFFSPILRPLAHCIILDSFAVL